MICTLTCFSVFAHVANAGFVYQTVTFENLTPGPLHSYSEGDYIISWWAPGVGDQPIAVDSGGNIAIGDSNTGFTNGLVLGAPIRIRRADGGLFDLVSVDFANVGSNPTGLPQWAPETFTGFEDPFPTTSSSFVTFYTPEERYTGLTEFGIATLGYLGDNYLLDNIQLRSHIFEVPEPSTLTMLTLGTGGALVLRRRRTKK